MHKDWIAYLTAEIITRDTQMMLQIKNLILRAEDFLNT